MTTSPPTETQLRRIFTAWAFYMKAKNDPQGQEVGAVRDGLEWVLEEVGKAFDAPAQPHEPGTQLYTKADVEALVAIAVAGVKSVATKQDSNGFPPPRWWMRIWRWISG